MAALSFARFDKDGNSLVLTVTCKAHIQQILTAPQEFKQYVRKHTGWHVVITKDTPETPLSQAQKDKGYTPYTDTTGMVRARRPQGQQHSPNGSQRPARLVDERCTTNNFAVLQATDEADEQALPECNEPMHTDCHDAIPPQDQRSQPSSHGRHGQSSPRCAGLGKDAQAKRTLNADTPATPRRGPPAVAAREARQHASNSIYVGTWNARDCGTDSALGTIQALAQVMDTHGVAVMAVQEMKRSKDDDTPQQAGLTYHGSCATRSEQGRRTAGTGFLVTSQAESFVTYLGPRPKSTHILKDNKHTVEWLKVWGTCKDEDMYLGSVYMPAVNSKAKTSQLYEHALEDAMTDLQHYNNQKGKVLLLGDWNARVGHENMKAPEAHPDLMMAAPKYGENKVNPQGKLLLRACADYGLQFLSGSQADTWGPTCTGHGRNQTTGQVGTSVVDHIIGPVIDWHTSPPVLPPLCFTMTQERFGEELTGLNSDHVPVLLRCKSPGRKPKSRQDKQVRVTYRLENLHDRECLKAYQSKIEHLTQTSGLLQPSPPLEIGDQIAVDRTCQQVADVFCNAGTAALGIRKQRSGGTRRWMDQDTARLIQNRLAAHRAYTNNPSEANKLNLYRTACAAQAQCKQAMRNHRAKLETDCITAWREAPQSRRAHKCLDRISNKHKDPQIAALVHPDTKELSVTPDTQTAALTAHYAKLARAQPAEHPARIDQIRLSTQKVRQEWQGTDAGPAEISKPYTPDELATGLRRMANNKASGEDGMPAELLKRAGWTGTLLLTKLFNTILATECIPSGWRQGVIVSVYKADDPTDCSNYRGITILSAMDKLWSTLVALRLESVVQLHDHQYGFRAKRGTTNALFNLATLVRQQISNKQGLYVFFLDARKAFDTVPHDALLSRLIDKGVTGKMWRLIATMYRHATSKTRVGNSMGDPFPIEQGVAQGCPLSPLLYIIFADDMLQSIHADNAEDGVQVATTDPAHHEALAGQSYADDLAAMSTTPEGLQRIIDRLHEHSLRWGWTANTKKSVIMSFGDCATRHQDAHLTWAWKDTELKRVETFKYLGLHFHESGCWEEHVKQKAHNANVAFIKWSPVLASPRLSVALKLNVIKTHIVPIMSFAMEVWSPEQVSDGKKLLEPFKAVYDKACRLACGVHRTRDSKGWQKRRGVSMEVLRADLDVIPMHVHMSLAHSLFMKRMEALDNVTDTQEATPLESQPHLQRTFARDHMGTLLRSNLPDSDPWKVQCKHIPDEAAKCARHGDPEEHPNFKERLKQQARQVAAHSRTVEAAPLHCSQPAFSSKGRPLTHRTPHPTQYNPVGPVVSVADKSGAHPYLRSPRRFVWPIMALRSAHLPGDYSKQAQGRYSQAECPECASACVQESETLQPLENNWRHIQHTMFMCKHRVEGPTVQMLHHDLLAIAQSDDNPALEQLVHTAFGGEHLDWRQVQQGAVSFVMEPNAACRQAGGTTRAAKTMQRVCAAYCHGVAAAVTGEILDDFPALMRSLPGQSQVAAALALLIPNGPEIEPDSDVDEWMHSDTDTGSDSDECMQYDTIPSKRTDIVDRGGLMDIDWESAYASVHKRPLPPSCDDVPAPPSQCPKVSDHHRPWSVAPPCSSQPIPPCGAVPDCLSDSDDEVSIDGRPRIAVGGTVDGHSTHDPVLSTVPAPASVPSPSGLRGRCPAG